MKLFWISGGVGLTVYGIYAHWPVWAIVLNVVFDVYNIVSYLRDER